ncbi:UNVERIFIED_CONTAM: hypothetical protein FKN15_068174 [Acipenser sinensis]
MALQQPRAAAQPLFELCAASKGTPPSQSRPPDHFSSGRACHSTGCLAMRLQMRVAADFLQAHTCAGTSDLVPCHNDGLAATPSKAKPVVTPGNGSSGPSGGDDGSGPSGGDGGSGPAATIGEAKETQASPGDAEQQAGPDDGELASPGDGDGGMGAPGHEGGSRSSTSLNGGVGGRDID